MSKKIKPVLGPLTWHVIQWTGNQACVVAAFLMEADARNFERSLGYTRGLTFLTFETRLDPQSANGGECLYHAKDVTYP